MDALLQTKHMKRICILILLIIWGYSVIASTGTPGDSIGVKQLNGESFILYKVGQGETIYSVSRKYGIPYSIIASSNPGIDLNNVKAGQQILVPADTNIPAAVQNTTVVSPSTTGAAMHTHIVEKGETLYRISKNYNVEINALLKTNPEIGRDYAVKTGQKITIPNGYATVATVHADSKSEPEAQVTGNKKNDVVIEKEETNINIETPATDNKKQVKIEDADSKNKSAQTANSTTSAKAIKDEETKENTTVEIKQEAAVSSADKIDLTKNTSIAGDTISNFNYSSTTIDKTKSFAQIFAEYPYMNLTPISEKGVCTWIDGSSSFKIQADRYYALANSSPIGSIVKIRNLMNNRVIYAKVIGTLSAEEVSEKVIVKLSAGASEKLNVLDNRFVVEVIHFEPNTDSSK
jgi:LysM repeat protein